MKTKVWLLILLVVVLLAVVGEYALYYRPMAQVYHTAMEKSAIAPYEEAQKSLTEAVKSLSGRPLTDQWVKELTARKDEMLLQEADRAVAADELTYAAQLLETADPDRAKALIQEAEERAHAQALKDAYEEALSLEQAGRDEDALAAFRALEEYEDASERANAIEARMAFAAAQAVFTGTNFDEAIAALNALDTAEGQAAAEAIEQQKQAWIEQRRQQFAAKSAGRITAGAWHTAALGASPWIAGDGRYGAAPAEADHVFSGLTSVFFLRDGKVLTTGETFGAEETIAALNNVKKVAPGLVHGLFLLRDGTVIAVGSQALDRLPAEEWTGMVDVAAGAWHSLALRQDGTVEACGTNDHDQCAVKKWKNIVSIDAGLWHSVGLRADGTVVACGDNTYGQCDVRDWTGIVSISCGACTTVGLRSDGTVVACGDNGAGQCDVSGWKDIAAIAAGAYHTVGLGLDGRTVTAGSLPAPLPKEPLFSSDWIREDVVTQPEAKGAPTVYIQGEDTDVGPWLYMDDKGAVLICIDFSEERELFRTDMLATRDALPSGRVTNPSASGNYIIMPSALSAEQAQNHHAVLAFTGDYIGWTSNRKGVMIRNGVTYYDRDETGSLAIMPDGTLKFFPRGEVNAAQLTALGVRDSFSFGPLLVENGQRLVEQPLRNAEYTMRVVLAYSDPYHYLAVIAMRDRKVQMTHAMMADACVRYGCRMAYNLDGGHSTSLVFMGKELSMLTLRDTPHTNIRGLSDVIVFLENDKVGAPPEQPQATPES